MNTTASTRAAKEKRMASSQKVGSTSTLDFITTKELPQMMVARISSGLGRCSLCVRSWLYLSFDYDKIRFTHIHRETRV